MERVELKLLVIAGFGASLEPQGPPYPQSPRSFFDNIVCFRI